MSQLTASVPPARFVVDGSSVLDPRRVGDGAPAGGASIFDRLPITPASPFRPAPLRLVATQHDEGGRRWVGATYRCASTPPVRLTRRGRVVVVVFAALIATVLSFGLGLAAPWAGAAPVNGVASGGPAGVAAAGLASGLASSVSVVVQPGDTLWSIATAAAPRVDPRVTVQKIIDRNGLSSAQIQAGQVLVLPS